MIDTYGMNAVCDGAARSWSVRKPWVSALTLCLCTSSAWAQPREVASYDIDARLDPAQHTVHATATVRWVNPSVVPTTVLWLHLYLNAFRDDRSLFMRSRAVHGPVEHPGRIVLRTLSLDTGEELLAHATGDPSLPNDATQLRVTLPRPVGPGETVTLHTTWDATLPTIIARTGYSGDFHMVAQWFPKLAVRERDGRWVTFAFHSNSEFYSDFGRYNVKITVPRGWVVGATGVAAPSVTHDNEVTHRFSIDNAHDFAFTAWPRFSERRSRVGSVALRILSPPGCERTAARVESVLRQAMPVFARRFGPYPYQTLTAVIPPRGADEAAGMEYPSLITLDAEPYSPVDRARSLTRFTEYVTLHEFGHQYFYGLLASDEHRFPFLDEGLCEWATGRVMQDLYGPSAALVPSSGLTPAVGVWAYEGHASGAIESPLRVDLGAAEYPSWPSYTAHVYARTASVLHTAEHLAGEARWAAAMRAYTESTRWSHPTPSDFFAALRANLDTRLVEGFVRPAIETAWSFDQRVTVAQTWRERGHWVGRVVVQRRGPFQLPTSVELEDTRGRRRRITWDSASASLTIPYAGDAPLRVARIDPDRRIEIDADRTNDSRLVDTVSETFSLTSRVAWWVSVLLSSVGP